MSKRVEGFSTVTLANTWLINGNLSRGWYKMTDKTVFLKRIFAIGLAVMLLGPAAGYAQRGGGKFRKTSRSGAYHPRGKQTPSPRHKSKIYPVPRNQRAFRTGQPPRPIGKKELQNLMGLRGNFITKTSLSFSFEGNEWVAPFEGPVASQEEGWAKQDLLRALTQNYTHAGETSTRLLQRVETAEQNFAPEKQLAFLREQAQHALETQQEAKSVLQQAGALIKQGLSMPHLITVLYGEEAARPVPDFPFEDISWQASSKRYFTAAVTSSVDGWRKQALLDQAAEAYVQAHTDQQSVETRIAFLEKSSYWFNKRYRQFQIQPLKYELEHLAQQTEQARQRLKTIRHGIDKGLSLYEIDKQLKELPNP